MAPIAINGRFLTRSATGVDRHAGEIIAELDKLVEPGEMVLLVPSACTAPNPLSLANIETIPVGRHAGILWEQLDFMRELGRRGAVGLNLCGTAPLLRPDVVCVHDMATKANPHFFSRKFVAWYKMLHSSYARRARLIVTVSEFSKKEIERYYPRCRGRIVIVPNAWQHILRTQPDAAVLERAGLGNKRFWLALGALAPNKNLNWLVEVARRNPGEVIAVAGKGGGKIYGKNTIPQAENVIYLGYVSDGEARALLESCKALLFPTFYEGFGIPPMEALACGAKAVVSDTEIMHEVYGDSVFYVDPHNPDVALDEVLAVGGTAPASEVLERYSWRASAQVLWEHLRAHSS